MIYVDVIINKEIWGIHINEDSEKLGCDIFNKSIWCNGDRNEIYEVLTKSIRYVSGKEEVGSVVEPIMKVIGMRI